MNLFFDTETTGLPLWKEPSADPRQPHLVQLAALLLADKDTETGSMNVIIRPDGWAIPDDVARIHGITTERALDEGIPLIEALDQFNALLAQAERLIAHNIDFDTRLMRIAYLRAGKEPARENLPKYCTMRAATPIVRILHGSPRHGADWKWPKLEECVRHFFDESLEGAHDALVDVRACARVYWHLKGIEVAA